MITGTGWRRGGGPATSVRWSMARASGGTNTQALLRASTNASPASTLDGARARKACGTSRSRRLPATTSRAQWGCIGACRSKRRRAVSDRTGGWYTGLLEHAWFARRLGDPGKTLRAGPWRPAPLLFDSAKTSPGNAQRPEECAVAFWGGMVQASPALGRQSHTRKPQWRSGSTPSATARPRLRGDARTCSAARARTSPRWRISACRCRPASPSRPRSAPISTTTAAPIRRSSRRRSHAALAEVGKIAGKTFGDAAEPAARLGALGRARVDAGHDGHGPEPRPERRDRRGAGAASRRRALRL